MTEAWRLVPLVEGEPQPARGSSSPTTEYGATSANVVEPNALQRRAGIRRSRIKNDTEGQEPSFTEAWRMVPVVEPSLSAKVGAAGQSATGAFLETAPMIGGAVMGAQIGAPFAPPFGSAAGTVIGGIAGALAGRETRNLASRVPLGDSTLTTPSVEHLRPELRPYGRAGEVIGAGAPIATLPLAAGVSRLPEFSGGKATQFVNRIIDNAQRNPGTFAAGESAGLTGAAAGSGVAENYRPGDTATRVGAEIAGGFFNPTRLAVGAARSTIDAAKGAIAAMSRSGREQRAAAILQDIVNQAGEDPAALAQMLRQSGLPGVNVTSAQATGSPALIALEKRLVDESAKFGAQQRQMAEQSIDALKTMLRALEGSGNPEAMKAAAELRSQYFRTLLAGRVESAERQAIDTASKISPDTPNARMLISAEANKVLENALDDARSVERDLWSKVPHSIPAFPKNILQRYDELRGQMLPEEALPPIVEGFVQRMRGGGDQGSKLLGARGEPISAGETSSGELLLLRSRMLLFAREASAKGALNEARMYGAMAEAALDDLAAISAATPEIAAARQFSRELNDTFTRTFAGEAMSARPGGGARATGAERVPPELMMRRALGAGRESGAIRFRELEEAMRFLPQRGLGGPEAERSLDFMLDAQQRILRMSAAEAIDPRTGRASAIKLSRFLNDNAELLDRFPEVKRTLESAVRSESRLAEVERMAKGAEKAIEKKAAFARVGRFDSPADAVRSALLGNTPRSDFGALAKLAHRGGTDAVDGLKASTFEDALRRSSTDTGELSFERLQAILFNPVRPGQPSLIEMMRANGLMSAADGMRAKQLVERAMRIEKAMESGGRGPDWQHLVGSPDALLDLVIRIGGAKAGTAMASATGPVAAGHGLIAASAGSSYARKVLEKVPQGRVKDVLIEAAVNPDLMATLLMKPKTPAEGIAISRQLHAYLLQAGLTSDGPEQ